MEKKINTKLKKIISFGLEVVIVIAVARLTHVVLANGSLTGSFPLLLAIGV